MDPRLGIDLSSRRFGEPSPVQIAVGTTGGERPDLLNEGLGSLIRLPGAASRSQATKVPR